MRGLFSVLLVALVAIVAGVIGFQAGVLSNIGTGTAGVNYVWLWGFPHFGGFLFFLLIVAFLLAVFGGRRRHWGGRWGYGPGGPGDPRREWVADMHRRLHEEEAGRANGSPTTSANPADRSAGG